MAYRFAAVDVAYFGNEALAAAVIFSRWEQAEECLVCTSKIEGIALYEPGKFYWKDAAPDILILKQARAEYSKLQ